MLKDIRKKLLNIDVAAAGIVLAVLIIYTFASVIMRYFVNRPLRWGEEFQLLCIVVIVFLGAGAGFRTGSHIAIDFLVDLFPRKLQNIVILVMYFFSIGIILYFFIQSGNLVKQMHATQRVTEILRIPLYIVYASFPVACVLIIVNYTIVTFSKFSKPKNGADEE